MKNENHNKVNIFISSKCDSGNLDDLKYGVMRKALALLLEETGLCRVFVFEEGTATSRKLVHSYMDSLADSDLVVIIVDNQDGISQATMREINRAKALNKKCIYIFCDQRKREITELQAQIQTDSLAPRYNVVHEFSDIPEAAYRAVIEDVVDIYISYCKGRVTYNQEGNEEELDGEEIIFSGNVVSNVSKEFMKGFQYTKYIVQSEAGLSWGSEPSKDEKDENCARLLGQIIGCASVSDPNFEMIKEDIAKLHTGKIQNLILMRYDAVAAYFRGEIKICLEKLEKCIELCTKQSDIPKWLMNDIAIDLRNIQIEIDRETDIIRFDMEGQKILDKDNELLYYPVIDRMTSDYYADIAKYMFNNLMNSSHIINLGSVDYTIEKACNVFLVAYFYGSITHMIMIRKKLYEYLMTISLETREHKTFLFTIRLLLMNHDEKALKKFLYAYGENTNSFNEMDIRFLLIGIEKQPLCVEAVLARIFLFKYFGYYFSDEQFKTEAEFLIKKIRECIENKCSLNLLIKPMLEAMSENKHRFSTKKCLDVLYWLFEFEMRKYYDDAFKCLCNLQYDNLSVEEQECLQDFLIDSLKDENIRNNCNHLFEAAQTMRQNEGIAHNKLDDAVRESSLRFYEDTYLLNVAEHDNTDYWKYTKRFVDMIESDTKNNGKNGVYAYGTCNPYRTIENIITNGFARYNSAQMKIIIGGIYNALMASNQTIEAKTDAMELLCVLQGTHPKNRRIKVLCEELSAQWSEVVVAKKLFYESGYGRENLELNFILLQLILHNANEEEIIRNIVQIQNGEIASRKIVLSTIERLLNYNILILGNEGHCLVQYAMSSSYDENYEIRFWAMVVLTRLLNGPYRKLCLERLVEMIDEEPYQNKVGMLSRLEKDDLEDPKIKYIFDKGKSDAHYWVRIVAERPFIKDTTINEH